MIRIGLTGNIACGKSTVAAMLADLGALVIDADRVAHQVMAQGTPVWERVIARFGRGILGSDGEIDREKLAPVVFADPQALRELDAIVHPAVIQQVEETIAEKQPRVVVVEAIKLVEAGMHQPCDSLWVVTCSPQQQVARLMASRRLSEAQARARLEAQGSDAEKVGLADVVIRNDSDLADTRRQVEHAWRGTMERLGASL